MKFIIDQSALSAPYHALLRQAGYSYIEDRRTGQGSFVRPLGNGNYPRFHMYVDEYDGGRLAFKVHLDQKQAIYEGVTAHSGEYDDGPVLAEADRLKRFLGGGVTKAASSSAASRRPSEPRNPWAALKR